MPIADKISEIEDYSAKLVEWQEFWMGIDGKKYDFSNVIIPQKPKGKWRLLIIVDILLETLYAKCDKTFSHHCRRWAEDDLDEIVVWNERDAKNGSYAIWVRELTNADEKFNGYTADDIKAKNISTETLSERMIHELKVFYERGRYLDDDDATLCTGSRYSNGRVPVLGRSYREPKYYGILTLFHVGTDKGPSRPRQVVALKVEK